MTLPGQAFGFYPVARKLYQAFMPDLPTNTLKKCLASIGISGAALAVRRPARWPILGIANPKIIDFFSGLEFGF